MAETRIRDRGRRSRLTAPVRDAIVEVLRNTGCSRAQAARHVEVSYTTFARWMERDVDFCAAVEKAENDYDVGLLARARIHATRDAKSAQFLIERHPRLRAEWGQKAESTLTLTGPDGLAPIVEVKHTHVLGSAEQLAALAAAADVLVRVGVLPALGTGAGPRPVNDEGDADAEVVEVHPA